MHAIQRVPKGKKIMELTQFVCGWGNGNWKDVKFIAIEAYVNLAKREK